MAKDTLTIERRLLTETGILTPGVLECAIMRHSGTFNPSLPTLQVFRGLYELHWLI